MNYTDNAINVLTLKTFKGVGRAWISKNIKGNETLDTLMSLLKSTFPNNDLITSGYFNYKKECVKEEVNKLIGFADGLIAIGDISFPPIRGTVKHSEQPVFLFYKGDINLLQSNNCNIAVIGLLTPDGDTAQDERKVVSELVKHGATIVSGLALGCDTIAHQQALDSNGKTVAILPGPLSTIMPAANKRLADEILNNGGLLISEYYFDSKSKNELSGRYQERDRLQALFSDGIVLAASYAKNNLGNDSGSRLAMEYAKDYAVTRAVIYNRYSNSGNPKYDLNRQLIREDDSVKIINNENLHGVVEEITKRRGWLENNGTVQTNLFG